MLNKFEEILEKGISASMLNLFLIDKSKFFERYILEIRDKNIEEIAKANTLGNIVHDTIEELYTPLLNKDLSVKQLIKIKKIIKKTVGKKIKKYVNIKSIERGKNIIIANTAVDYVKRLIERDIRLCKEGNKIKVLEVEKDFTNEIVSGEKKVKIRGKIDRIDLINDEIRLIDYKTGKLIEKNKINIKTFEDIKNEKGIYALQLLFYAIGVKDNYKQAIYGEIISSRDTLNNCNVLHINGNKYFNKDIIEKGKNYIFEIINQIMEKEKTF